MKANEAPKSKFVYPDKLYARTNNNITLDISYAPQTLEAVEYTRTDALIEKAFAWLKENKDKYLYNTGERDEYIPTCSGKMIDDFRKYMEGE